MSWMWKEKKEEVNKAEKVSGRGQGSFNPAGDWKERTFVPDRRTFQSKTVSPTIRWCLIPALSMLKEVVDGRRKESFPCADTFEEGRGVRLSV